MIETSLRIFCHFLLILDSFQNYFQNLWVRSLENIDSISVTTEYNLVEEIKLGPEKEEQTVFDRISMGYPL